MSDLNMFRKWHTWRRVDNEDAADIAALPVLTPATFALMKAAGKIIGVSPTNSLMVKAFVEDADGETFVFRLSGWADNGPGTLLMHGTLTGGNNPLTNALIMPADEGYAATDVWRACETLTIASSSNQFGISTHFIANLDGTLIIPAHGFTFYGLDVVTMDGTTGVEAARCAVIYKPIPYERDYTAAT